MSKRRAKLPRAKRGARLRPAPRTSPTPPTAVLSHRMRVSIDVIAHLAVPVGYLVLLWALHPFHQVLSFGPDEGNNVIKALMLSKGHVLYSEIWSDQPPLFTWMLRAWLGLTEWSVHQARLLVLGCASVLLWALYQTVRLSWGHVAAAAAVLLLVVTENHLRLSVSVMLAVPTLMFVMLSIYALARYRNSPHAVWMAVSGVFLALGLFTKLIAGLVAPLVGLAVVYLAWSYYRDVGRRTAWLMPISVWCGGFVVTGAIVLVATVPVSELGQLIAPHVDDRRVLSTDAALDAKNAQAFKEMLLADGTFALLGIAGVLHTLRKREWFSLLAALWYLLALAVLRSHRPLWYHHYMLLAIPMCWAAGIAVGALLSGAAWRSCWPLHGAGSLFALATQVLTGITLVVALSSLPPKFKRIGDQDFEAMTTRDRHVVALMRQFKEHTRYAMSDRQILPFSAGLVVPPELSVTSRKRMRSGHLAAEELVSVLERYEPELIYISWRRRIPVTRELLGFLEARYALIYRDLAGFARGKPGARLYVVHQLEQYADDALRRAMAEVPDSAEAVCNWGLRCAEAGRYDEAIRYLDQSIGMQPTAPAYHGLSQALDAVGRVEEAAVIYRKLLRILEQVPGREDEAAQVRARLGLADP